MRNCREQATGRQWLTNPSPNWTVGWTVCGPHYGLLQGGEAYLPRDDQWPSTKRWLLMGQDLVVTGYAQTVLV